MSTLKEYKKLKLVRLCIAVTFFTSGLLVNCAQLLLFLTVKPFSKYYYRKILYYLNYSIHSQLVFVGEWWSNSRIEVWVDEKDAEQYIGKEHVLLIMNHTYEIDWLGGWMYAEKCNVLGNCKAYAKRVLSYLPVIGWSWKFSEFVFLERSYDKDKEIIAKQLKEIMDYPDPIWLLLNAEGTRFTEKKHEASIKFAHERGLPVLQHHLIPRTKGFTSSLPTLQNKCVIYDINIAFRKDAEVAPTLSNILNGEPVYAYMFVRRIPIKDIPIEEGPASEWLHELFRQKDKIIDSFHTTGSFFKTSGHREPKSVKIQPRLSSLINFVLWAIFSISVVIYYLCSCLYSQNWIGLSIALTILLSFHILMEKVIGMSKISKASSYGATDADKKEK